MAESQSTALPPLEERPLVTFALFAYNQEKYIREAVEGAFAQTYEPLEIILSDDCSTDRTFQIMEEMATRYRGPHLVRLNRNKENLGIGAHVDSVDRSAKGELIVHAAGDDISLPERTAELYRGWIHANPRPTVIVSDGYKMDERGRIFAQSISNLKDEFHDQPTDRFTRTLPIIGCTLAFSRELLDKFSSLPVGLIAEDALLYRRAFLLNGVKYIPNKLVKYRSDIGVGVSSVESPSAKSYSTFYRRWTADSLLKWRQLTQDMTDVGYDNAEVVGDIKKHIDLLEAKLAAIDSGSILDSIRLFISCFINGDRSELLGCLKLILALKGPYAFNALKRLTAVSISSPVKKA